MEKINDTLLGLAIGLLLALMFLFFNPINIPSNMRVTKIEKGVITINHTLEFKTNTPYHIGDTLILVKKQ